MFDVRGAIHLIGVMLVVVLEELTSEIYFIQSNRIILIISSNHIHS
jgi:hypothetical protein